MGRHNASWINNIADEGSKREAVQYLQETWDDLCDLRAAVRDFLAANATIDGPVYEHVVRLSKLANKR